jgi:WxcM-like, C-terminal
LDCRIIDLPTIADARGNLTFIEGGAHVPFSIERGHYLYDVPGGAERAGHAHKALHQLIIAMSGSCLYRMEIDAAIVYTWPGARPFELSSPPFAKRPPVSASLMDLTPSEIRM